MKTFILLTYLIITSVVSSQTYKVEEVKLVAHIQTINGINQKSNDFSPIVLDDKLYFTSSRPFNKHLVGENNWKKNGYLNIFYGSIQNYDEGVIDIKNIKLLSNRLNSGLHTGPISFSTLGDTLFFSRIIQVSKGKEIIYKAQLFTAIKKKNKWTKIRQLPFSTNTSSNSHPSYDSKRKRLYFASDREGGKGEFDIYYAELKNGKWQNPINETAINTIANEKFPFVINGNIFFSSDRSGGEGQLDIYYNSSEFADYPIKLEGLNSAYDDFGISLLPDLSAGYFSSNKNGNDDIYYFTLERKITIKNELSGSFTYRSLAGSVSDLSVQLYNENGEFVYQEKTDNNGYFKFENVELDSNFSVRIGETVDDELALNFFDEKGKLKASFLLNDQGAFRYKKLFYENSGILNFIPDDRKDFVLNKAVLSGKLIIENEPTKNLKNEHVILRDKNNVILVETITDSLGNFEFTDLDLSKEYYIEIPYCTDELLLLVYDTSDKIYAQLKCNAQDEFMYRRLKPELKHNLSLIEEQPDSIFMMNNSDILGRFTLLNSEKDDMPFIVRIYNENGTLLSSTMTDSLGNFRFNNLSSEIAYKFTADSDQQLELTLFNRYGKQIAKIQEEDKNYFIFRPLGFQTKYSLSLVDDKVEFNLNLSSRYDAVLVYFNTNKENVNNTEVEKLKTVLKLLKKYPQLKLSVSAYADATASDEYNFLLSQKRGEWVVNYFIKNGIDSNRFTINAYGETKLIDPENDAINRRAELRVYQ